MSNETIYTDGVILGEMDIEEVEDVVAAGILATG